MRNEMFKDAADERRNQKVPGIPRVMNLILPADCCGDKVVGGSEGGEHRLWSQAVA